MEWKEIGRRIERLSVELKELLTEDHPERCLVADLDEAADDWVRQYVRSRALEAPAHEVGIILLARAQYAASFLNRAPDQEIPVPISEAATIVETVMIDLWYRLAGSARWVKTEQMAFAA